MKRAKDLLNKDDNSWRMWRFLGELADSYERLDGIKGISIFGGHRLDKSNPLYEEITKISFLLSNEGYDIITGGGGGVMEAANRGCKSANNSKSVGLTVEALCEGVNSYCDIEMPFRHFAIRKYQFLNHSRAVIFMPGGVGTLDELFTVYCLVQTKVIEPIPVICYKSDYWAGLFDWMRHTTCAEYGFMTYENFGLVEFADNVQEVLEIVSKIEGDL